MDIIKTNLPYEGYCVSRQGGRPENQDTVGYADTPYGLLVVLCDGMGGGPGGKTASLLAVESIVNYVSSNGNQNNQLQDRKELIKEAISNAEQQIINFQKEHIDYKGMGTTVVALLLSPYSAIVAHVGDSRCYQFRNGHKKFRTEDHSFVADLVRKGNLTEEQARLSSQSNIITRALSGRSSGEPTICELDYEKGDRFVLCTDGIWGMMPEPELQQNLVKGKNYPMIVERLALNVDQKGKKAGGGHDNLTLSLIVTKKNSEYKEPMSRKYRILIKLLIVVCVVSILGLIVQGFIISNKNNTIDDLKLDITELESSVKGIDKTKKDIDSLKNELKKKDRSIQLERMKNPQQMKELNKNLLSCKKDLRTQRNKIEHLNKISKESKKKKDIVSIQGELKKLNEKISNLQRVNEITNVIQELSKSCTLDSKSGQVNILVKRMDDIISKLNVEDIL